MAWLQVVAVTAAIGLAFTGAARLAVSGPRTVAAKGHYWLAGGEWMTTSGGECVGTGGMGDFVPGMRLVLADAEGKSVAATTLGVGASLGYMCLFAFDFGQVPKSGSYTFYAGTRGGIIITSSGVRHIELSIGG
jgi:hypothetical protein